MPTRRVKNSSQELQRLSTDFEPGALVDRDFEIVRLAGRGSFSTVYEARQRSQDFRPVALKVLHRGIQASLHKDNRGRVNPYRKEQRLCERLTDTAVCAVYEVGQTLEQRYYAAMEWAPGVSLDQYLKEHTGGLPQRQASDVIVALGRTLVCMHEASVIHRDIKPSNVMVNVLADDHLEVHLLDFGIAKLADEEEQLGHGDMLVGTPAYMSPEQAAGERTDARSDIFGLAAMAYEMLTGARHIQLGGPAANSEGYVGYLLGERPLPTRPARAMNPKLPKEFNPILSWGLKRDPNDRPSSVGEFLDELVPMLHTYEPPADTPTVWQRLLSRLKR